MNLKQFSNVTFEKSITKLSDKPAADLPELVFVGRSNVGKSSLINALCNRRKLAHTSTSPGKTQVINYYKAANTFYIVDLPGYGYAKLSKKIRNQWPVMIEKYLLNNKNISLICLLIDSRHELMKIDEEMISWLTHYQLPFHIILTKTDKLSRRHYERQLRYYRQQFPDYHVIPFSVSKELYSENLRKHLLSYLNNGS